MLAHRKLWESVISENPNYSWSWNLPEITNSNEFMIMNRNCNSENMLHYYLNPIIENMYVLFMALYFADEYVSEAPDQIINTNDYIEV